MIDAPRDASLNLETEQGNVTIPLADLSESGSKPYLNGQIEAERSSHQRRPR